MPAFNLMTGDRSPKKFGPLDGRTTRNDGIILAAHQVGTDLQWRRFRCNSMASQHGDVTTDEPRGIDHRNGLVACEYASASIPGF